MPTWTPDVTSDTSGSTQEITVAVQNPVSGSEGTVTTTRTPNIIGSADSVTYSEYEDLSALLLEEIAAIATRPNPDILLNATYRVALDLSAIDISGAHLLIDLKKWAAWHGSTDQRVTSTSLGSVLTEVTGSDKADFIIGTNGDDTLNGGDGADRFALNADYYTGSDTVTDFGTGSDKVVVNTSAGTETTLAELGLAIADDGTDSFIYTDNDDDGSYNSANDTLYMTLQGFTSWDDSTHLDVV